MSKELYSSFTISMEKGNPVEYDYVRVPKYPPSYWFDRIYDSIQRRRG